MNICINPSFFFSSFYPELIHKSQKPMINPNDSTSNVPETSFESQSETTTAPQNIPVISPQNTETSPKCDYNELETTIIEILQKIGIEQPHDDPYLTQNPIPKNLEVYPRLQEYLPSISEDSDIFHVKDTDEFKKYYDINIFSKTTTSQYTAPTLTTSLHPSDKLKRNDQELAALTNMALKLCRPIDNTAHSIISSTDPETTINQNILFTLDFLRHSIALLVTKLTYIRTAALYKEKGFVAPPDPSAKDPLIDTTKMLEHAKLSKAVKRADYGQTRAWGRGQGRGRSQYRQNYNGQNPFHQNAQTQFSQNNQQSQTTNSTNSAQQQYQNTNGQYFFQAPPRRGRGRGRSTTNQ